MNLFAILPFFLMLIVDLGILVLIVWFAVSLIKVQRERNIILKEISNKLDNLNDKNL